VCDFWRGTLSARRLGVLIRHLPVDSALVSAINDGGQPWTRVENLLADLWALLVKVHGDPAKTPEDVDHPARAEMAAAALAAAKKVLKAAFTKRRDAYAANRKSEEVTV
jgi:hypothetical protein